MLVEDDETLGFLIKDSLDAHGWQVHLFKDGEKGLTAFHNLNPDLCILDIMLPEKDGFTLAAEIRKYNQKVPIVFLTARGQTEDRIKGFQNGADDYVCKPFSIEEFKYRLEAILKRSSGASSSSDKRAFLHVGKSVLDVNNLTLTANGLATRLTYKEARILQLLFRHAGKLVERGCFPWRGDHDLIHRAVIVYTIRIYVRNFTAGDYPAFKFETDRRDGLFR